MKVAIVSFGHADSAISMAKYNSEFVDLDLYYVFSQDRKRNNIIDFTDIEVKNGLQSDALLSLLIPEEVVRYANEVFNINFFIYESVKLRSFFNMFLSINFAGILRQYNVIHFNGTSGILPWLIMLLFDKKLVFTIHDYYPHSGEGKGSFLSKFINRKLNKFKINSKHHAVIQNKFDYSYLLSKERGAKNISFIPFGQLEIYKCFQDNALIDNTSSSDILFFGRISKYKGIDYLLEAFERLWLSYPQIKLIIAGSGELDFKFDFKRYEGSVLFLNRFIDNSELVNLIQKTKVVVCPYTDATQSGVAMTAFALGKPVVASNVGGFSEIIENGVNGYLVEPRDAYHLYTTLQKIFSDNDSIIFMSNEVENNNCLPEIFQWENIAKNYLQLYSKL
ncbi:glycosyltransferase family 4 protein [Bacteroidota bacterium]